MLYSAVRKKGVTATRTYRFRSKPLTAACRPTYQPTGDCINVDLTEQQDGSPHYSYVLHVA